MRKAASGLEKIPGVISTFGKGGKSVKLDCELTQELYSQYHDGDLNQGVGKRVEEHLSDCKQRREAVVKA